MKLQYNNYSVFSIFEWVTVKLIIVLFFFFNLSLVFTIYWFDVSVFSFQDLIAIMEETALDPFVANFPQKSLYLFIYLIGAVVFFIILTTKDFKIKKNFYLIDSVLIIGFICIYFLLILLPLDILNFSEYKILYALIFLILIHLFEAVASIFSDYIKNDFILLTLFISLILFVLISV